MLMCILALPACVFAACAYQAMCVDSQEQRSAVIATNRKVSAQQDAPYPASSSGSQLGEHFCNALGRANICRVVIHLSAQGVHVATNRNVTEREGGGGGSACACVRACVCVCARARACGLEYTDLAANGCCERIKAVQG